MDFYTVGMTILFGLPLVMSVAIPLWGGVRLYIFTVDAIWHYLLSKPIATHACITMGLMLTTATLVALVMPHSVHVGLLLSLYLIS